MQDQQHPEGDRREAADQGDDQGEDTLAEGEYTFDTAADTSGDMTLLELMELQSCCLVSRLQGLMYWS